jgi:uncharacterized phage protein gp47/JayE
MAYETQTKQAILDRLMAQIPDDIDKRQGSITHDMLSPAAIELALAYIELDNVLNFGFADTTYGEYLDRKVAEAGLTRKPATKAIGQVTIFGDDGVEVPKGYRVLTEGESPLYFETKESATITGGHATVSAEAVEGGEKGNVPPARITLTTQNIVGITSVTNEQAFTGGVDEESDDELRARYLQKVRKPITSGNIYHYEQWALSIEGVSAARVFPTWDGNGTVKVVLINDDGRAPDQTVVANTLAHIENVRPIGATVTVVPVTEIAIDVSATLSLDGDLTPADVSEQIAQAIGDYLSTTTETEIRLTHVGNAILSVNNVLDYSDLTLNGQASNITIDAESVAVLGEVTLT